LRFYKDTFTDPIGKPLDLLAWQDRDRHGYRIVGNNRDYGTIAGNQRRRLQCTPPDFNFGCHGTGITLKENKLTSGKYGSEFGIAVILVARPYFFWQEHRM
jgi:hypothetical protein